VLLQRLLDRVSHTLMSFDGRMQRSRNASIKPMTPLRFNLPPHGHTRIIRSLKVRDNGSVVLLYINLAFNGKIKQLQHQILRGCIIGLCVVICVAVVVFDGDKDSGGVIPEMDAALPTVRTTPYYGTLVRRSGPYVLGK
jgi:hypothetical protein